MSMVFKNVPSHIRASSSSDGVAVRPSGLTRPVGKMMEDSTVSQRPMRMTYPQIQGEKNPGGPCFIRQAGSPRPERCLTGVGNNFHVQLPQVATPQPPSRWRRPPSPRRLKSIILARQYRPSSSVPNYSLPLTPSIPNSYSPSDRPDGCLTFDNPITISRKRPSALHHGVHIRLCPRCPLYEPHRERAR